MSALLIVVARTGLLAFIMVIVALFAWPDITSYLIYVEQFVNYLFFLDPIFDMDTFFSITKLFLAIEVIFLLRRLVVGIVHFISSGSFTGGGGVVANDEDV